MRLKRLEVYGFKSFADHTVIEFNEGITGVVGPNGSGKSNISDAVRWVLGEQSAKSLRGGKMEDVIFNGTEKRRRLGYCEVSLVFDNEDHTLPLDFAEVMITRRVYRTGEGEYFINKAACRLKDILDLFRDTGIGRDGYSIIGQGRIDEILSQKSDERRGVFEEAAGISKYRVRKEESEKRLANMQENFTRIEDILEELGSRLQPLEEASKTARQYLALRDELRILECTSFVLRTDRDTERIEEIKNQIEDLNAQIQKQDEELTELSAKRDELNAASQELEHALTEAHSLLLDLTREKEAREGSLNLLQSEISRTESEAKTVGLAIEEGYKRLESLKAELEQNHREGEAADADIDGLLHSQREALKLLAECQETVQKAEQELEDHQNAVIAAMNRLSDVKSSEARLMTMKTELLKRREDAAAQQVRLHDDAESLSERKEETEKRYAELSGKEQKSIEELTETETQTEQVSQRISGLYQEIEGLNSKRTTAESRLRVLKEMVRDYAGYQQPVKRVMQKAQGDRRIRGIVASLIQVPKELEKAVEAVLSSALQNIVTDDEYAARDMIEFLKQNSLGRATFLPISAIRGRTLQPAERDCLSMKGCLGVASEMIRYEPEYRNIIENLLGRTVIADNLDSGIQIMRKGRYAFRLVTLAGDVMHPGGSMSGGSSASRMTSLLSREREIKEHEALIIDLGSELQKAREWLEKQKEAKASLGELHAQQQQALHETRIDLSIASEQLRAFEKEAQDLQNRFAQNEMLRTQIETNLEDIERQLHATQNVQSNEMRSSDKMHQMSQEIGDRLAEDRNELERQREAAQSIQLRLSERQKDADGLRKNALRLSQEQKRISESVVLNEEKREKLVMDHQDMMQQQAKEAAERDECNLRLSEAEENLKKRQEERWRNTDVLNQLTAQIEKIHSDVSQISDRVHKAEIIQNRLQNELNQARQRIWDEYELSYSGAKEYYKEDFSPAKDEPRITGIRQEIRHMGPVNLSAMEEFRNCKERYEDLNRQKEDMVKARADLEGIIRTLQKDMENQFLESFKQLQKNLSVTFVKLFGGGSAELRLVDEKDILGSGIEIAAQPPGKKLQTLTLLSGGERALTAIAILFAMLKLKPTPFCFLDEIEAALDDGNISTFASYLKEFSRETQFVIVTHRKGTMEFCDSLYGVSMEEKGVSKMLSVELKDIDDEAIA